MGTVGGEASGAAAAPGRSRPGTSVTVSPEMRRLWRILRTGGVAPAPEAEAAKPDAAPRPEAPSPTPRADPRLRVSLRRDGLRPLTAIAAPIVRVSAASEDGALRLTLELHAVSREAALVGLSLGPTDRPGPSVHAAERVGSVEEFGRLLERFPCEDLAPATAEGAGLRPEIRGRYQEMTTRLRLVRPPLMSKGHQ